MAEDKGRGELSPQNRHPPGPGSPVNNSSRSVSSCPPSQHLLIGVVNSLVGWDGPITVIRGSDAAGGGLFEQVLPFSFSQQRMGGYRPGAQGNTGKDSKVSGDSKWVNGKDDYDQPGGNN